MEWKIEMALRISIEQINTINHICDLVDTFPRQKATYQMEIINKEQQRSNKIHHDANETLLFII